MRVLLARLKNGGREIGLNPNHISEIYEDSEGYVVVYMISGNKYIINDAINSTLDSWYYALNNT